MSNNINAVVNRFPSLTWNSLDINNAQFSARIDCNVEPAVEDLKEGVLLSSVNVDFVLDEIKSIETGMGKDFDLVFDDLMKNFKSPVHVLTVKDNVNLSGAVPVSYNLENGVNGADDVVIYAGKDSSSEFVFYFSSPKNVSGNFGIRLRIITEENAKVRISYVNLLGPSYNFFVSTGSNVLENAGVEFNDLMLGGEKVYNGNKILLSGYKSSSECHSVYIARKNSFIDLNYIAEQTGRESSSYMFTDGVMAEGSAKNWRGTIDFKKGCVEAKGDEQENVLLLSPDVVNKTLPVILCDEEDVEGRHGSTIGKLGKDVFLYMQSRGIDEENAKKMLIKGKVNSACKYVDDALISEKIMNYVEGVLDE